MEAQTTYDTQGPARGAEAIDDEILPEGEVEAKVEKKLPERPPDKGGLADGPK